MKKEGNATDNYKPKNMKKIIKTTDAPAPIGPYNQAILAGNTLYISGQIALNPVSSELETDNIDDETEQVIHAMRAGAMAFCKKDITSDDLVAVIRDVMRGNRVVDDMRLTEREMEVWINEKIHSMSGTSGNYILDPDEHYIPLSARETQILQYVTDGMSNKEIARKLGISQQTVKNHMTSILNKLNVKDRTQAAVTAIKNGWVQQG